MRNRILNTNNESATLLIRLMVGTVFISEGIQKFLFDELGAARFEKIGLPNPDFLSIFVASFEILCGTLILIGLLTRFAAIPILIIMLVAIITTKIPIGADKGIWPMLHESRTDWAMLLGSFFLLVKGGGKWSLDQKLAKQ